MRFIALTVGLTFALTACQADQPEQPGAITNANIDTLRVVDGFETETGEVISFLVTGHNHETDIIVRSKRASDVVSEVMPLTESLTPLELWQQFSDQPAPNDLQVHHKLVENLPVEVEHITIGEDSLNFVYEDVDSGEGDCIDFRNAYTWTNKYRSPVVTSGVTASLGAMERFRTGACNRSTNSASETLEVYLDRWTSGISGWQGLFSEEIVRGESVEYTRYHYNCSYYQHRLRVVPSSSSTYYRYAGQWADVTCGGISW